MSRCKGVLAAWRLWEVKAFVAEAEADNGNKVWHAGWGRKRIMSAKFWNVGVYVADNNNHLNLKVILTDKISWSYLPKIYVKICRVAQSK